MGQSPKKEKVARMTGTSFFRIAMLTLAMATVLLSPRAGRAWQHDQPMSGMSGASGTSKSSSGGPCDDLSSMGGMSVMGESMGAMTNHMCITPMRPKQPGDEEKAKAVVAQVKASIEKYKDYKKALADGYVIANPMVDQPQAHFTNAVNVRLGDTQFDPTKPSSLLYFKTPTQRYKLEGVMFTDRPSATEDELNERIPLSIARWHEHTNFCAAPADKVKDYHGNHPKFGMFGSIHTQAACQAEGGTFMPLVFSWMIHVFPYEDNMKDVFSMDDDESHAH
jgi:hypothetical protein